jgi:hypothetical protein
MYGFNINIAKGTMKRYYVIALLAIDSTNMLSVHYLSESMRYTNHYDDAMHFDALDDARRTYLNMKKKFIEWAKDENSITVVDAKFLEIREQPEIETVYNTDGSEQFEFKDIYKSE